MTPASPAILTANAAQRLPRWVLLLLGLLYIAPGLIGRDAWKPIDGTSIGIMLDLAQGHANWWQPTLLGQATGEAAWLPYWLGAWSIQALPFLDPVLATRLPLALALLLTMVCTWYASFSLALQPLAQPVRFAFGGHAEPVAYARAIADTALLALVACLGLAIMGHEASPHPFAMAATAALLQVAAEARRVQHLSLRQARLLAQWALAVVALMASGYPGTAGLLGALALWPDRGSKDHQPMTAVWGVRLFAATSLLLVFLAIAWPHDAPSSRPWAFVHLSNWARTVTWYAWPAWPLFLIGLWTWRRQWRSAHVAIPLTASLIFVAISIGAAVPQRHMLLLLPALAPLAAFAVPTIRRSVLALFDWLALLLFSAIGVAIGVYGLALDIGWPSAAARAAHRLLPGLEYDLHWLVWLFAAAITMAWVWTVRWRTNTHQPALWKSLILPAAGTTWCWALLMSLWLPALNYGMSYERMAQRLHSIIPNSSCVLSRGLPPALNAALMLEGIRPMQADEGNENCGYLVASGEVTIERALTQQWQAIASLWQVDGKAENVQLFKRVAGY